MSHVAGDLGIGQGRFLRMADPGLLIKQGILRIKSIAIGVCDLA
jgi:hypothetical protein